MARTVPMVATGPLSYGTRRLQAGDLFACRRTDAGFLAALGKVREPIPEALGPQPEPLPEAPDDLETLRAQFHEKFGRAPYARMGMAALQRALARPA